MTYKLTANKTKMHALAEAFLGPEVPSVKETSFTKYRGGTSFAMAFASMVSCNYTHKLYLTACAGKALLTIETITYNNAGERQTIRKVWHLTLDELRERGMLREVPDLKEA